MALTHTRIEAYAFNDFSGVQAVAHAKTVEFIKEGYPLCKAGIGKDLDHFCLGGSAL